MDGYKSHLQEKYPSRSKSEVTIFFKQKSYKLRSGRKSMSSFLYKLRSHRFFLSIVPEFPNILTSLVLVSYKPVSYLKLRVSLKWEMTC